MVFPSLGPQKLHDSLDEELPRGAQVNPGTTPSLALPSEGRAGLDDVAKELIKVPQLHVIGEARVEFTCIDSCTVSIQCAVWCSTAYTCKSHVLESVVFFASTTHCASA